MKNTYGRQCWGRRVRTYLWGVSEWGPRWFGSTGWWGWFDDATSGPTRSASSTCEAMGSSGRRPGATPRAGRWAPGRTADRRCRLQFQWHVEIGLFRNRFVHLPWTVGGASSRSLMASRRRSRDSHVSWSRTSDWMTTFWIVRNTRWHRTACLLIMSGAAFSNETMSVFSLIFHRGMSSHSK